MIGFSPRVPRLFDADLLPSRVDGLDDFAALWALKTLGVRPAKPVRAPMMPSIPGNDLAAAAGMVTVATADIGSESVDLAVDSSFNLWASAKTSVLEFDSDGAPATTYDFEATTGVIEIGNGAAWVAFRDDVALIDRRVGEVGRIVDVLPGWNGPKVVDMAATDEGVWVADKDVAVFLGVDGTIGETVTIPSVESDELDITDIAAWNNGAVTQPDDSLGVLILAPADGGSTSDPSVTVEGYLNEPATVTVDGVVATVDADLRFSATVQLPAEGINTLEVVATGNDGSVATAQVDVTLDTIPPAQASMTSVFRITTNLVRVVGTAEPGALVEVRNTTVTETELVIYVTADDSGSFTADIPAAAGHQISVLVTDVAGNSSAPIIVGAP